MMKKSVAIDAAMETALVRAIVAKRFNQIQNSNPITNLRERVLKAIHVLDNESMTHAEADLKGNDMWDYLYADGKSERQIMDYYEAVHRFCRAWEFVFAKIDGLLKKYPTWDFNTVYESIHICDNCHLPVLEGYVAGTEEYGHYCSTECMLIHMPFSQYVEEFYRGVSYYTDYNLEEEALGILGNEIPYDQNGKPIRVGSIVQWNDPAIEDFEEGERDDQISRRFEVCKIAGEIIHLSDSFGDVEAYSEELIVIKY